MLALDLLSNCICGIPKQNFRQVTSICYRPNQKKMDLEVLNDKIRCAATKIEVKLTMRLHQFSQRTLKKWFLKKIARPLKIVAP